MLCLSGFELYSRWVPLISNLSAAVLFFLRDTVDIVGRFYGNEWKVIPFWIHRFFSQWKILMIGIFYLILDFSKETHLKI